MSLNPADVAQIRELLALGKREEAIQLYQVAAQCDRAAAETTVVAWSTQLTNAAIMNVPISAKGVVTFVVGFALAACGVASVTVLQWSTAVTVFAVVLGVLGTIFILLLSRPMLLAARYLTASSGTATILGHALVGKSHNVLLYRLHLEIRSGSSSFQADVKLPVKISSAAKIQVGRRLRVKFFPGDPSSVIGEAWPDPS